MSKPLRVLVVEDSEDDMFLILRNLRQGGYEPQINRVETRDAMRAALEQGTWEIVLSDYSLPQFNALGALSVLKESGLDIPFIIVSGTIDDTSAVTALKAGAHDFLTKNNMARLIPAIERELREVEARRKRREAEEAAHLADQRFRSLIEHSSDGITLTNSDGTILYGSPAVTRILGYDLEEWAGMNSFELIHPDDLEASSNVIFPLMRTPRAVTRTEYRVQHKDGSYRWLEININNLLEEPSVQAMVSNFRDVTERRALMESLNQRTQRLEMLHRIDQAILALQSPELIAEFILEFIRQQFSVFHTSVILFDFEANDLQVLGVHSQGNTQLAAGMHFPMTVLPDALMHALQEGNTFTIEDVATLPQDAAVKQLFQTETVLSSVWIPFVSQGALISALNLGTDTPTPLSAEQIEIAHEVANQLAIAIQQTRYQEQIEQHAAVLEQRVEERTSELQRSRNRIESILNSSSDTIILTSSDGVIQQVNPAFDELFLYTIDDVFGQSLLKLVIPEDHESLINTMRDVINEKQPRTVEVTAQRNDRTIFDGDMALAPIIDAGVMHGMVCSLRDVTINKQLTRELQMREEKYRALVNFAPHPIVMMDTNGKIVFTNARVEKSLGYKEEELVGQSIEILLPKHIRDQNILRQELHLATLAARSMAEDLNLTILHKDGNEIPVNIDLSPVQTDDELMVMAYIVDITAHRLLEANLRAALNKEIELNELKTRFVSMVSHDFRTPLTIIQSSAETLRLYYDRLEEEKRTTHFDRIRAQINRMIELLNDVLTINRADANAGALDPEWLDMEKLCREIAEVFPSSQKVQHELKYSYTGQKRPMKVDEKLIYRAITNLLTNAFKYSPAGSPVEFKLAFEEAQTIIQIRDHGIGIPPADQVHLFKSFHRASNVGPVEGTGLGLAIVKHAVEAHNGTVSVESQINVGSTFTIIIPATGS
ncbi:MAG: PAS domain S-box protein [Anaerolineae bacterium]|nr:PAS domain S-box protein [Anaerolineae bacterium]